MKRITYHTHPVERNSNKPDAPCGKGTAHRPRLYMERCSGLAVGCVRGQTEVISLVEIAEPLSPPFEVKQAQSLLNSLSLESRFVLSNIRPFSSLEALVKSGRR